MVKNISFFSLFWIFSFCFLFISDFPVFCQTPKQWTKLGDEAITDADFFGAAQYFKNALTPDSSATGLLFKYAQALRQSNNYSLAEYYYQKVLDKEYQKPPGGVQAGSSPDKNDREKKESCLFWLATMQKFNGHYDEAKENFNKFDKISGDKSSYFSKKAKQEVKSCAFAKKLIADSIAVTIKNSGTGFNTFNSEFNAQLFNDSILYFSSVRPDSTQKNINNSGTDYRMKIYTAVKKESNWFGGEPLDTVINNTSSFNGNGTFSKDKKRFYFSRCNAPVNKNKPAIYYCESKNGIWQQPVKMENGINMENYTSTQPHITEIEGDEIMFFVSDMPGGKGKLDIWSVNISEMKNKKNNIRPKNLAKINSIDNEISPWYDSKNKFLYFSSEWYFGLGGFDIFKSKSEAKGFSNPQNLGFPINTSFNDLYFSFYPDGNHGFFTSNRKGSFSNEGETCCNDIYEYFFPDLAKKDTLIQSEKKFASLEMLNKYLPVTLYFHNDEPNPKSRDSTTSLNYIKTYDDYLNLKEVYSTEYSKGLPVELKGKAKSDIENFFSDYAEKGISDLELFSELLITELEKGQKIELTVKGYASPLAKTDYNVSLTLRRISSLENYLREVNDGIYLPYLNKNSANGGALEIVKIPFGEYKADTAVSDNLNDQRNSVYSRKAALERKIEIISVSQANTDSLFPEMNFEEEIFDFGTVEEGEKLSHVFNFVNNGKKNLKIKNVTSGCGCTAADWPKNEILPGKKEKIFVTFNTEGKSGKQLKTVSIESNAVPSSRVIHVTAEIISK